MVIRAEMNGGVGKEDMIVEAELAKRTWLRFELYSLNSSEEHNFGTGLIDVVPKFIETSLVVQYEELIPR